MVFLVWSAIRESAFMRFRAKGVLNVIMYGLRMIVGLSRRQYADSEIGFSDLPTSGCQFFQ